MRQDHPSSNESMAAAMRRVQLEKAKSPNVTDTELEKFNAQYGIETKVAIAKPGALK